MIWGFKPLALPQHTDRHWSVGKPCSLPFLASQQSIVSSVIKCWFIICLFRSWFGNVLFARPSSIHGHKPDYHSRDFISTQHFCIGWLPKAVFSLFQTFWEIPNCQLSLLSLNQSSKLLQDETVGTELWGEFYILTVLTAIIIRTSHIKPPNSYLPPLYI